MASEIQLRLYEELNGFLPPSKRKRRFAFRLNGVRTVGELLMRLGVPRREVELVLINGDSAGFSRRLRAGDFVSLYPVFESLDVMELLRARRKPLRRTRFMAGPGLLPLARRLRRLGFDTLDCRSWEVEKIVRAAREGGRILLTKNPSLLKSPELSRIYLVRAAKPKDQLLDVLSRFDLFSSVAGVRSLFDRMLK